MIDWRLRTMRLPKEIFRKRGSEVHVSIGNPISVEEQNRYKSVEELGTFLREQTYKLRSIK